MEARVPWTRASSRHVRCRVRTSGVGATPCRSSSTMSRPRSSRSTRSGSSEL